MRKHYANVRRTAAAMILCAALLPLVSCPGDGGTELPFLIRNDPTAKYQPGGLRSSATRVACYIDVDQYSPMNVLDYTLADGTRYFDYVVLGSAELKKGAAGVYIHYPPALDSLFKKRFEYIVPLQKMGIKVLLGLKGGHDGVALGTLSDEDRDILSNGLVRQVDYYTLDGVELWDIDGAKSADECPYPEGIHTLADGSSYAVPPFDDPGEAEARWLEGGKQVSNFILKLRTEFSLSMGETASDDMAGKSYNDRIIILREDNFCRWMPNDPPIGVFVWLEQQFNYTINADYARFGGDGTSAGLGGAAIQPGHSVLGYLSNWQYGPLIANLAPDSGSVIPPLVDEVDGDGDIFRYSTRFKEGLTVEETQYNLIYYQNLRPVSAAAADNALHIPAPLAPQYPGKTRLTQAEYLSITAQAAFGQEVICSGGDRLKDW